MCGVFHFCKLLNNSKEVANTIVLLSKQVMEAERGGNSGARVSSHNDQNKYVLIRE